MLLARIVVMTVLGDLDQAKGEGKTGLIAQILADPPRALGNAVAHHQQQEASGGEVARDPVDKLRFAERPARLLSKTEEDIALTIRPMPEGAYVVSAVAGTPAATAGLRSGMLLTHANGIALAGMGAAMGKLLDSDAALWSFETAAGQRIELRRAP